MKSDKPRPAGRRNAARASVRLARIRCCVLALTAFEATFGLLLIFVVIFPALVQGILAVIAAAVAGERHRNKAYEAKHGGGSAVSGDREANQFVQAR